MIEIVPREMTEREKAHRMLELYFDAKEQTGDYLSLSFNNYAYASSFHSMEGEFSRVKEYSAVFNNEPDETIEYLENLLKKESQEAGTSRDSETKK